MRLGDPPKTFGPKVRVRCTFGPICPLSDIVVEVRFPHDWREVGRFPDDQPEALERAHELARFTRVKLLEGEFV